MSLLTNIYYNSLAQNEGNLRFWEDYLNSLKALDLSVYSGKLTVPALIPIGSRILFRGEIKHTNEVTVSLGADYFTKCSVKQAEILRNHRIKDAQSKVDILKKEKEYIETQISFKSKKVYEKQGQEIVEFCTKEEDEEWRKKHRENVRKSKQNKGKDKEAESNVTDEELWSRLEELELQEELENELNNENNEFTEDTDSEEEDINDDKYENKQEIMIQDEIQTNEYSSKSNDSVANKIHTSKFDILKQVLDKQHQLENKLAELKNKNKTQSKTEQDLISRVEELEQLDDLEDEMERLENIIEDQEDAYTKKSEPDNNLKAEKLQRRVSFADEDESETLELVFKHTDIEPVDMPYNPEKGITKPSDVYLAYSNLFGETTSILKKSKYNTVCALDPNETIEMAKTANHELSNDGYYDECDRTIVVKDVMEKDKEFNVNDLHQNKRPVSLFKKRRQQQLK